MKMILLAVLATAALVGCASQPKGDGFNPKLALNDKLIPTTGLFKGNEVVVVGAERCKDDGQGTYAADITCYNLLVETRLGTQFWQNVSQRELLGQ
jgi:hypothetical protein